MAGKTAMRLGAMRNFHELCIKLIGINTATATICGTMIVVVVVVVIIVLQFGLLNVLLLVMMLMGRL